MITISNGESLEFSVFCIFVKIVMPSTYIYWALNFAEIVIRFLLLMLENPERITVPHICLSQTMSACCSDQPFVLSAGCF